LVVKVFRVSVAISAAVRAEVVGVMADAMSMRDGRRWVMQSTIERELFVDWPGEYRTELGNASQDMR